MFDGMRCYHVLVHGRLTWQEAGTGDDIITQPVGFHCNRWVLASNEADAAEKAFVRVRMKLNDWLSDSGAELSLEPEKTSNAPIYKLLAREQGFIFYTED